MTLIPFSVAWVPNYSKISLIGNSPSTVDISQLNRICIIRASAARFSNLVEIQLFSAVQLKKKQLRPKAGCSKYVSTPLLILRIFPEEILVETNVDPSCAALAESIADSAKVGQLIIIGYLFYRNLFFSSTER